MVSNNMSDRREEKEEGFLRTRTATIIFYIGFVLFLVFILYKNRDTFDTLSLQNAHLFIVVLILLFIIACTRSLLIRISFNFGTKKLGFFDSYKLLTISVIGNYLPFSGGLIARGYLLKRDHGISYKHYTVISVYILIVGFVVSGLVGIISTLIVKPESHLLLAGFALMLLPVVLFFIPIPNISFITKYLPPGELNEPRRYFKSVAPKIFIIFIVLAIEGALSLLFCFMIFGQDIPFINILLLCSGNVLTRIITISPGAVGIREGIAAALAYIIGVDYQLTIIAIGVDRLAEIIISFGTL